MSAFAQLNTSQASYLKLIPRNAKRIAFVGIEAAEIGNVFKHLSPSCHLHQLPNLKGLKKHAENAGNKLEKFDVIVLKGQIFTEGNLKTDLVALGGFTTGEGVIILELQNPFYFSKLEKQFGDGTPFSERFIKDLLARILAYAHDIKSNVETAGFRIEHIFRDDIRGFSNWLKAKIDETPSMAKELGQLASAIKSPKVVIRLNRKPVPQLRIQAQVLKPVAGVNDVRIDEPLAALSSLPGVLSDIQRAQKLVRGHADLAKIFLWHRPILTFEKSFVQIQQLRRAGYLIITEFDDHYSPWPKIEENKFLTFAGVHAVQTTTNVTAELFSTFNPEVAVFPNQLNFFPDRDFSEPSDICRIFFGALNRQADWRPIMPLLNEMLSGVKGKFHFDVVMDREFFDALETDAKEFTPQCPYEEYKAKLLTADVSLMPLLDTEFNRMKSDLKLVEAAGCGAVPLASATVYKQSDPNGAFAVICQMPDQFVAGLKMLIDNKENRLERQIRGREYVQRSRMISHHVQSRYDWLLDLCNRKEELDKALGKRLEALTSS